MLDFAWAPSPVSGILYKRKEETREPEEKGGTKTEAEMRVKCLQTTEC